MVPIDAGLVVPDEAHDTDVVGDHRNRTNPCRGRLAVGRVFPRQIAAARVTGLLEDHVEVVSAPVMAPSGRVVAVVTHSESHECIGCIRRFKLAPLVALTAPWPDSASARLDLFVFSSKRGLLFATCLAFCLALGSVVVLLVVSTTR